MTVRDNPATRSRWSGDTALLIYIALATMAVHLAAGGRYGFHRDELALLDDARHLAWGYVAYPPLTPFFARLALVLFGTSLDGFRFFAALAQAVGVLATGLMARELGGSREAQLLATMAALPACIAEGTLMQYVSFDYLFWVLTAYFILRLVKSRDTRWWIAIGVSIGLGMMSKYTMLVFVCGVAAGVVLTDARGLLKSRWLLAGIAASFVIFLPNLLWQIQNHFVSLDFLQHIHARDVRIGRTKDFLPDQLRSTALGAPLWTAGLVLCAVSERAKRWRALAWMYIVPLVLFVIAKGRGYYMAPAYPMLYGAGSVWLTGALARVRRPWASVWRGAAWTALAANVVLTSVFFVPIAPVGSRMWRFAAHLNGDLREEIGWQELVQTVAQVRDSLPASERAHLAVLTANYGEAGAINLYGPAYGLPPAISGINSFWARGYGSPPPDSVIVLGLSPSFVEQRFTPCRVAAKIWNPFGVRNEEAERPDILVCGPPRAGWETFWKDSRYYG